MNSDIVLGLLAGVPIGGIATSLVLLLKPGPKPLEPQQITDLIETVRRTTNLDAVQRNHAMQLRRARRKTMRTDNTNEPARVFKLRSGKMPRESKWGSATNTTADESIVLAPKAVESGKDQIP